MKVLLDTNIVIDAIAARSPFEKAAQEIVVLTASKKITAAITANTAGDIYYLAGKYLSDEAQRMAVLKKLFSIFDIVSVDRTSCLDAFDTGIPDYEASLLAACAARWKASYIITRDQKTKFQNSPVPALSPQTFLERL
jgi:predicted nucleic acid-binding protein